MDTRPALPVMSTVDATSRLTFKAASEEWEFDQIHRLNHRTFAEEIPQHPPNPKGTLVDRFHDENTYFVCLRRGQLLGMVAVRDKRPFSLDQKLEDLDSYLPVGRSICEIRLLAVEPKYRAGRIMQGLLTMLARHCLRRGYDIAIISGTVRQMRLYERLGFVPFGPMVGTRDALYQPMYCVLGGLEQDFQGRFRPMPQLDGTRPPVNLLPGPVEISSEVRKAFSGDAVSHRSPEFLIELANTKRLLRHLVRAQYAQVLMGSGTLANDVIAGQLSLLADRGLVLVNGEFGERLVEQARRFGLRFEVLAVPWGQPFDRSDIKAALLESQGPQWLWAVHCETSTGVLNDLAMLKEVCRDARTRLCVDCVSSIGTVPVDLTDVYLASGVSGKGLGSFSGLCVVFHDHNVEPSDRLPIYLDLGLQAGKDGSPFTMSSNLVRALETALQHLDPDMRLAGLAGLSSWLRRKLIDRGLDLVAPEGHSSPAVITVVVPAESSSGLVGRRLEEAGYLLSYNSEYLRSRNWIQICLMGDVSREAITPLLDLLPRGGAARI